MNTRGVVSTTAGCRNLVLRKKIRRDPVPPFNFSSCSYVHQAVRLHARSPPCGEGPISNRPVSLVGRVLSPARLLPRTLPVPRGSLVRREGCVRRVSLPAAYGNRGWHRHECLMRKSRVHGAARTGRGQAPRILCGCVEHGINPDRGLHLCRWVGIARRSSDNDSRR